jgi:hypothetical protein
MEMFELVINTARCQAELGAGVPFAIKIAFLEVVAGIKPLSHFIEMVRAIAPHNIADAILIAQRCGLGGV